MKQYGTDKPDLRLPGSPMYVPHSQMRPLPLSKLIPPASGGAAIPNVGELSRKEREDNHPSLI